MPTVAWLSRVLACWCDSAADQPRLAALHISTHRMCRIRIRQRCLDHGLEIIADFHCGVRPAMRTLDPEQRFPEDHESNAHAIHPVGVLAMVSDRLDDTGDQRSFSRRHAFNLLGRRPGIARSSAVVHEMIHREHPVTSRLKVARAGRGYGSGSVNGQTI